MSSDDMVKAEVLDRLHRLTTTERHRFNPPGNTGWLEISRTYPEKTEAGEDFLAIETIRLTYDWEKRLRLAHWKNGTRQSDICLVHLRRTYRDGSHGWPVALLSDHWNMASVVEVAIPMLRRYMILDDLADV